MLSLLFLKKNHFLTPIPNLNKAVLKARYKRLRRGKTDGPAKGLASFKRPCQLIANKVNRRVFGRAMPGMRLYIPFLPDLFK